MNHRTGSRAAAAAALIFLFCAAACLGQISFDYQVLAYNVLGAMEVSAADIDGDGDMDVATTAYLGDEVLWLENDGSEAFSEHTVQTGIDGPRSVRVTDHDGNGLDLDGDGDVDILAAAYLDNDVFWWENDGGGNFTAHAITENLLGAHTADPVDLDGDGDFDVVACGYETAWFENDGAMNFTRHDVHYAAGDLACHVYAEDMDGDGDLDLLEARETGADVICYENDGAMNFTITYVDPNYAGAHTVFPGDLDGDGDLDVFACAWSRDDVSWWENDGAGGWTKHNVAIADGAIWVDSADLDRDGDLDLIVSAHLAGTVTWHENDGAGAFTTHTISAGFGWVFCSVPADVDGDSDLDVVACSRSLSRIGWWTNDLVPPYVSGIDAAPASAGLFRRAAPNPFNPRVVLAYSVPKSGSVRMTMHDARGHLVDTLVDGVREAGEYEQSWQADGLPAGTYFCRITTGLRTETRKVSLVK